MEAMFFLGACSPEGFVSQYDTLFDEVKNLIVIKGGSGCGKSTFMRAIGQAAQKRGLDVTYFLCSSDPDSLDGVLLPELSLAYVDGTAPHVLEPPLCGGSMNYLNFGEFYDRQAMAPNEEEILSVRKENAAQYPYVTACLSAANRLADSIRHATSQSSYDTEMNAMAECLSLSALKPVGDKKVPSRRFLSAVTPKGLHFCAQTPSALCSKVYILKDNYYLAPRLLEKLLNSAQSMGHICTIGYSSLQPKNQPTYLLLPEAGVAFISESRDFPYMESCFCRIDLDSTLPPKLRQELEFYRKTISALLYQSVSHLREAKRLHDRIELLCKPFVDFSAVNQLTAETIGELFGEKNYHSTDD